MSSKGNAFRVGQQNAVIRRILICFCYHERPKPAHMRCPPKPSSSHAHNPIPTSTTRSPSAGASRLSVAPQGQGVVLLPGLSAAGLGLGVAVALVETTGLLAGGGEATSLAVLVDGVDDPVDARVDADGLVLGVNEDDLVVLVGGVLVDPVRVQDAQVGAATADTLLGGGLEGALVLELVHSLVGGLAYSEEEARRRRTVGGTLGDGSLAATAADADTVDDIALLGLVTEAASLVGARGARGAVDDIQLAELY
ncbi:hypothetical protein FJTKL_11098 [Diaporthe vaccinii]|uniref:Uncharacterized protein n=1 Tax=Diaporthe vaccinii TaxID=105482 RepID=A0ABR4EHU5_9PEZI